MTETRPTSEGPEQSLHALVLASIDKLDVIAWVMDVETRSFTWVSAGAERVLGYPVDAWLGRPDFWADHVYPPDRDRAVAFRHQRTESLQNHELEYRMVAADGQRVWIRDLVIVAPGTNGKARLLSGMMLDVSRAKETEEALHSTEDRFAFFSAAAHEGVFVYDQGFVADVNAAGARLLGYTRQELLGRRLDELVPPEDAERVRAQIEGHSDAPSRGQALRKDGTRLPVEVRARDMATASPGVRVAVMRDLSEQLHSEQALRDVEAQLRQSQKLEALGQLAGGIAHDFNNLLTVIGAYTDLLLAGFSPTDPSHADLTEVRHAATRAAELTHQLLAFGRKQALHPSALELNDVVRAFSQMAKRVLLGQIDLRLDLTQNGAHIRMDAGQMEQVLLNLTVNARDAMPRGGELVFRTRVVAADDAFARRYVGLDAAPGDYVELSVLDSGVGMDEATRSRAFEPFFTTKPFGTGTGLGLATVYGIMQQSGAWISVDSTLGLGTTFRLYFRLAPLELEAATANTLRSFAGTERVLVIDDEAAIRELIRRNLVARGYDVLVSDTVAAAAQLLESSEGARIDLVISDVLMPEGGGREIAYAVARWRPETPMLFISGYPDQEGLLLGGPPPRSLLAKPFTNEQLADRVREMLDLAGKLRRS